VASFDSKPVEVRGTKVRVVRMDNCTSDPNNARFEWRYSRASGFDARIEICDHIRHPSETFAHEIGHAVLGDVHSDDPREIMSTTNKGHRAISEDEAARAQYELATR
jgi:hypothetical protein